MLISDVSRQTSAQDTPALARVPAVSLREHALLINDLLSRKYGQLQWHARAEPLSELIRTVLSQHTSDVNADRAFQSLLATFGSWEAIRDAEVEAIAEAVRMGGLENMKAPRIKTILQKIEDGRGFDLGFLATLPLEEARAWLLGLPGVGPKTAACVLLFALGRPALPVDTHVHRVALRLGLIPPKTGANAAHRLLEAMLPAEEVYQFHMNMITHGRRTCKAKHPICHVCPCRPYCPYFFEVVSRQTPTTTAPFSAATFHNL